METFSEFPLLVLFALHVFRRFYLSSKKKKKDAASETVLSEQTVSYRGAYRHFLEFHYSIVRLVLFRRFYRKKKDICTASETVLSTPHSL